MTTKKDETPEAPVEPDVFEDENLDASEDDADFDVEETNKKEAQA